MQKRKNTNFNANNSAGFSLIEVVLAIGVFLVTVLALVGLLGPTLQSVDEVEKSDEVVSVVNTVNAFLQSSDEINPGGSRFNTVYEAVLSGDFATVFVFRSFADPNDPTDIELQVGFVDSEVTGGSTLGLDAVVDAEDFADAAGPIYRVVLSASSVLPTPASAPQRYRSQDRNANGIYEMNANLADYGEGYFAMEARIFAEDPPAPGVTFSSVTNLAELADKEPIFTYNLAVVR
jgi:type II secretory pathway pseudopilin PulG